MWSVGKRSSRQVVDLENAGSNPVRPPTRKLMPHQLKMLRHLKGHRHSALFCEMRTGKTLPTVRYGRRLRPLRGDLRCLVVAPNSALGSWEKELTIEGETDVAYLQGTRDKRLETLREGHRWNLINKEGWMVVPEIANRTRCVTCRGRGKTPAKTKCSGCAGHGYVPLDRQEFLWDLVAVDESSCLKNPRAKVTKFFLSGFRDAAHRVVLTGTPNPESELDMWCQVAFLHGWAYRCSSYWQFRAAWFSQTEAMDWYPNPGTLDMMREETAKTAFLCTRRDADMPDRKVRETRRLTMPKKLREAYDKAEEDFVLEYDGKDVDSTVYAGVRWQWMRRMCGGFVGDECVWRGKVDELVNLLRGELAREQVVVWYAYNKEIDFSEKCLLSAGISAMILYGPVSPAERRRRIDAFTKGETRVLLVQQKVAEFGADFSVADTAVVFSRHPGLLTNQQSEDRIVHPKKTWPLLYVDLTVRDTVDEDVSELIREKKFRSQKLFDKALMERVRERRNG